ncbi:flagellar biosynthesis protein FlhF [Desulfuromonas acetoxidans]|uniref:Flagellar biosynthesis protein FlhF n=1 Tax=Desulfuromonas acetoxidans (strain DSM 684 / 11070) TaxID=281689 RepID=Q1JZR9_DESA6|nr:flagellar biosynthesis protein FlhF [Desulfuromonas acetoxidans]EAT15823.1 GTP-binding signal recognition particle SRP54, G-domain [Desulfuromonas acetoxidans DSM 684]MBF0644975.1 flagellar biosynthesis protein FlhF [Desulfuromonas acetoxidans]NVD25632.1 flagellar biosynthesis protein FlhF [Desulfuromonas acetoxidans]NVE17684.1 flagellar biosynthesis protein FlhF [Desulfuromonas acetoxidans]
MQVRVFESEDMDSALRMIKEALGPDALILSSRTVRKGGMGLFGKPMLEVTAAVDANADDAATPEADQAILDVRSGDGDDLNYQDLWASREIEKKPKKVTPHRFEEALPNPYRHITSSASAETSPRSLDGLRNEVGELKNLVSSLVKDLPEQLDKLSRQKPQPVIAPAVQRFSTMSTADQQIHDGLTRLGIEAEAASTIAHYASSQLTTKQIADPAVLNAFFAKTIAELVQTTGSILPQPGESKRIALIGPTGVGKTTTIAKLAASHLLAGGKRVALVTIDTYRIAAVEQLKVYGEIMNLPVEVVMNADQLHEVLERHSDKDLVLIDTAGRSPKDSVSLQELEEFLHVDPNIEAHLVMSATTRERDLYEIYGRFSALSPQSMLLTKLDECNSLGVLLNIHLRNNCPISYLANGQKVPEDLVQATSELVSSMILESSEG